MKKLVSLLVMPLALVACAELGSTKSASVAGDESALSEEALGASEYSAPETAAASEGAAPVVAPELMVAGPKYYIGSPYKIEDVQYTPVEDWKYDQTGMARIVPVDLNGVSTTNGEKFDTEAMVATSKVLPLPSIVRVTNLSNGQSAIVRVNNRGPFVNSRLLDVSPAAARQLGMTGQTKVRVQILEEESKKVKELTTGEVAVPVEAAVPAVTVSAGPYTVQVGAYYSEDSANAIVSRIASIGSAKVIQEAGMYKIRLTDLSAEDARSAIERLRNEENMAPGLLKDGRWVNADSI